jgi:uncharacterized protein (TIGR00299 family) protein
MKIAWLELWTGLSGDMFVGALLDAGWGEARLRSTVAALGLEPFGLKVERRSHGGITGLGIRVEVPPASPRRGFREIAGILAASTLAEPVRRKAEEIFRSLAEAEARIHGIGLDEVHFHELGALDTLVDIVGAVAGVHELELEKILAGPIPLGGGEIVMAHGRVPSPAPATALLLEGWPVRPAAAQGEFLTPTGAALLRNLAAPSSMPSFRVERVGYGAGTREHPVWPNLARLWIGREEAPEAGECRFAAPARWNRVAVLEAQMDDMDPRFLSALADQIAAEGALDVLRTPVVMKKGRLGVLLTVICRIPDGPRLADLLLAGSTTLGVRMQEESRLELDRRIATAMTPLGEVRVKWSGPPDRERPSPEYEDLLVLARRHGMSLEEVQRRVLASLEPMRPRESGIAQDGPSGAQDSASC